MSKKKQKQSFTNPDLRRQTKVPAPPCEEIEQQLWKLLQPEDFTPMHLMQGKNEKKLRARVLTLPVMMAVVVSLVYRQIAGLREVLRVLSQEGLMWVEPINVSPQALSKRLQTLPVGLFVQIWQQVIERIRASSPQLPIPPIWQAVHEKFTALWIADASTYRDEIIQMGLHHTNPCQHQVRLVSVLWGKSWYHYLTNVVDPTVLSAQQVCDFYRRRWRIEDAFNLTKRLLGLAYLWVGDRNGVQIQIFATWIFYAVLNELSADVALALNQPLERISLEMVFRGLYHFARALLRGDATDIISYFVSRYKLLGLVKRERKRQRLQLEQSQLIWAAALS